MCLTLVLLKYQDIQVDVYEAAGSFKEIGAGVMVWGRSWEILTRMGLETELRAAENVPTDGLHGTCCFVGSWVCSPLRTVFQIRYMDSIFVNLANPRKVFCGCHLDLIVGIYSVD